MVTSFEIVHVDMLGPWKVKFVVAGKALRTNIQDLTMVDRATNWSRLQLPLLKNQG